MGKSHTTNKGKLITHSHVKHFLTLLVIKEIKATMTYNFTPLQRLKIKRTN